MPKYTLLCENCGTEFSQYRSPKQPKPRFCSKQCWDEFDAPKIDRETIKKLYVEEHLTLRVIGSRFHVAAESVRSLIVKYNIPLHDRRMVENVPSEIELRQMYVEERLSTLMIAERYNVSDVAVSYWLRKYNIPARSKWERDHFDDDARIPSENELLDLYTSGHNCDSIGEQFGISGGFVNKLMKDYGIEFRTPNLQKHLACKDGHIVRSGLELLVDNWLWDHAILHVLEPQLPFRGKADFLVGDIWIEVWGVVSRKSDTRFGGKVAEKYSARRIVKERLYREHGLRLIGLEKSDVLRRLNETLSPVFLLDRDAFHGLK